MVCEDVKFNEDILTGLFEKSHKTFKRFYYCELISGKELEYFTHCFKKATNLGSYTFFLTYIKIKVQYQLD